MPRFSFPVPGRRKEKQEPAVVQAPRLTKAQKLLGASQINVNSAISLTTSDAPRHWDTASNANSSISINMSESALTYDESHEGGLSSLTEDTVVDSPHGGRTAGFDEESGVLPRSFADDDINTDFYGQDGHSITDASSLRRKQSSSTIISYYDKSKVPLGISQQTSNSAMAKGLPTKASSLLDIDGSISQASRRKKKPAKLDLSRMFNNRKSSGTMTMNSERGLVLGPDMVTRSPSFMSVSPMDYLNRPHSSHRFSGKMRPSTRGSNREDLSGMAGPKQRVLRKKSLPNPRMSSTEPAPPTPSVTQEATGLKNLYAHYEQMTFRDVFAEQDAEFSSDAPATESEDDNALPMSPKTVPQIYQEKLEEEARISGGNCLPQLPREVPLYKDISAYLGGYGANVDVAARGNDPLDLPTLNPPLGEYSDSISSRHTRTSKASKRTAPSLLEIDLQQTSVLSLSSDSEDDDFVDSRPKTSSTSTLPSPRSQRDTVISPESGHRPTTSRSLSSGKKKDRSSGRSDSTVHFLPVPSPKEGPSSGPILPATTYSRASSASASTNSTTKPSIRDVWSPSRESRVSMLSTRTTQTTQTTNSISPANYTVHEARAITLIPAQGASYNSDMTHSHVSSPDQPTPPLSPSSVDFMMQSNHTSVYDGDQGSVRSASGSLSAEPPTNNPRSPTTGPGRFMAVTRQEELLLAALRKKRLRMRESIIAEFEEEQEQEEDGSNSVVSQAAKPAHEIRRNSIDAAPELHAPQPRSMSAASVSFNDFPMHFEDTAFPVPPSAGIRNSLRSGSAMSMPLSPRSKPPTAQLPPTPTAKSTPNADLDRVLMNLNKSTSTASGKASNSSGSGSGTGTASGSGSNSTPASDRSEDIFGGAVRNRDSNSSPRLSDCLNFDDDEVDEADDEDGAASESVESYDSFNFQTSANQSSIDPPAPATASRRHSQQLPLRAYQKQYLGVAKTTPGPTLPTVHDGFELDDFSEYDNIDEVDVSDTDDDYPVHNVDPQADMQFDHFGASNGNNQAQNNSHNSHNSYYGQVDNDEQGIPRPDSPLESPLPLPHKRAVRISAVGGGTRIGMEAGWWGHNG